LTTFQSTMSMTNTTRPMANPMKAKIDMKIVAPREAAAAPRMPMTRASRAKKPAMGWRIIVYVRLCRTDVLRLMPL